MAEGNVEMETRVNFERTLFYLEAGFTDPVYAEDVLLDFAQQDIENAEEECPAFVPDMKDKIAEYKKKLLPDTK